MGECLAQLEVPCVVVTLGARGCLREAGRRFFLQPGFRVPAVDTTAAGDTFCGALVAAMNLGDALPEALRYACAASALACMRLGAQSSIPQRAEVEALLRVDDRHARISDASLAAYCGLV